MVHVPELFQQAFPGLLDVSRRVLARNTFRCSRDWHAAISDEMSLLSRPLNGAHLLDKAREN